MLQLYIFTKDCKRFLTILQKLAVVFFLFRWMSFCVSSHRIISYFSHAIFAIFFLLSALCRILFVMALLMKFA